MGARNLAALGAIAVLGIGGAATIWPRLATRSYGVVSDDPDALVYVRAAGVRDIVMGAIVLRCALAGDPKTLEIALASCVLAPLADFLLVRRHNGNIPQLATHAAGVVGIAVVIALLRAEGE